MAISTMILLPLRNAARIGETHHPQKRRKLGAFRKTCDPKYRAGKYRQFPTDNGAFPMNLKPVS